MTSPLSAPRIRWRVDLAIPSKTAISSAAAPSGSATRCRDGWISSIGTKPAASMASRNAASAAGTSGSAATTSIPSAANASAIAISRAAWPAGSAPHATGPRGTYALPPPISGQPRVSARARPPSAATRKRGVQPDAARCSAQARDW